MTALARRVAGEPWLFWLLVVHMLGQGGTYLIKPMVSYRALDLGVDAAGLGLLSASFSLAPLAVALWLGRQVDRRGELLFVFAGNGLMMASAFGLVLVGGIVPMFLFFAGLGLGHLGAVVAAQGMVARGSDEDSYDRRFSAFSFAGSIGQFLGPAIAAAVAGLGSRDEVTRAILVGGGVLLATLPFAALIRPPAAEGPARRRHGGGALGPGTSIRALIRTPGILRAIVVSTTVLSAIDIVIVYLPALGEERGWSASLVGILLAIRAAASMLMRLVLGTAAARYGRGRLLVVSMAVSAVALMALPVDAPLAVVALLMIFSGAGLGIGQPLTMSWVASLSSPGARATALSLRLMGNRVGQVALPVVVGSVAAFAGASGVLGFTGVIVAISLVGAYSGLDRRTPAARRAQEAAQAARAAAIAAGSNAAPSPPAASTPASAPAGVPGPASSPEASAATAASAPTAASATTAASAATSSPSAASAAPAPPSSSAPEGTG